MGIPGIVARQTQEGVGEWEKHMARHKQTHGLHTIQTKFFCMNIVGRHKDAPIECSFAHFVTGRKAIPGNVLNNSLI